MKTSWNVELICSMALGHSYISCSSFPQSLLLMFATAITEFSEWTISTLASFVFTQLFNFEQSFSVWAYFVLTAVQNNTLRGETPSINNSGVYVNRETIDEHHGCQTVGMVLVRVYIDLAHAKEQKPNKQIPISCWTQTRGTCQRHILLSDYCTMNHHANALWTPGW